jgi:hypothetical protein
VTRHFLICFVFSLYSFNTAFYLVPDLLLGSYYMAAKKSTGTRTRAKPTLPVTQWTSVMIYTLIAEMSKKNNAKILYGMKDKNEVCMIVILSWY